MNIRELLIKVGLTGSATTGRELDKIDGKVDALKTNFSAFGTLMSTVLGAGLLTMLQRTGDQMQDLQSRIASATGDLEGANALLNDLNEHAKANRMSITAYADSWAKFNTGMRRMGKTTDDTTALVDGLSAAFRVNGTEGNTAAGALFQLTQSISGGTVQMEELNSLMDAQGNLYVTIAEDIGGTTTAFKKMVSDGKVTSEMLANSIIKNTKTYIDQLRAMPKTLGDVWTVVLNDTRIAINNFNNSTKFIPQMADKLLGVWDKLRDGLARFVKQFGTLDELAKHIGNILTPLASLLAIIAGFKALSFLASPIGMILGLAMAIGVLYDDYKTWKEGGDTLIDWSEWEPAIQSVIKAIDWIIDKFKELTGAKSDTQAALEAFAGIFVTLFGIRMLGAVTSVVSAIGGIGGAAKLAGGQIAALTAAGIGASSFWDKYINPNPTGNATYAGGNIKQDSAIGSVWGAGIDAKNAISEWWKSTPAGQGNWTGATTPGGIPLAPGNTPTSVNNTTTVTAPVTNNFNITQLPGESGEAFATRVAAMQPAQAFDPESLKRATGGR